MLRNIYIAPDCNCLNASELSLYALLLIISAIQVA